MTSYSPMNRVLKALNHEEADRVPYFLMLTYQGALIKDGYGNLF